MIRLENVSKVYKESVVALRDVCAEIVKGEFVFLVGTTGSGKTTLIKMMMREEEPSEGRIYVAGKDLSMLPRWRIPYLRRMIGCVYTVPWREAIVEEGTECLQTWGLEGSC